tara:strand:- start:187 stop:723 length:537 start_codon:yes stop_codon:yes gene_type:complete
MSDTNDSPKTSDLLVGHLLDAKRKHDEDKNVETEEVQHLQKGTDYLTTFLLQQGIKQQKTTTARKPLGLDELKKEFVKNLVQNGFVTIGENGRTILTGKGKEYLDKQTKNAENKVTLAKLKNLRYRQSLTRKRNTSSKKAKNKRKTSVLYSKIKRLVKKKKSTSKKTKKKRKTSVKKR